MKTTYVVVGILGMAIAGVSAERLHLAIDPALPSDMPASARFVQTGFDVDDNQPRGQWIACRTSLDKTADWCRVTDERGTVVYDGNFLPLDSPLPVPAARLNLADTDRSHLWVAGPAEQAPVPALHLQDGQVLVPEADRSALAERWARTASDSERYLRMAN